MAAVEVDARRGGLRKRLRPTVLEASRFSQVHMALDVSGSGSDQFTSRLLEARRVAREQRKTAAPPVYERLSIRRQARRPLLDGQLHRRRASPAVPEAGLAETGHDGIGSRRCRRGWRAESSLRRGEGVEIHDGGGAAHGRDGEVEGTLSALGIADEQLDGLDPKDGRHRRG